MSQSPPANYIAHDTTYQKLRARNAVGWDPELAGYQTMLAQLRLLLPAFDKSRPPKLLEIGCGAGNVSLLLAQDGYDVTGLDISPAAVQWAQERAAEQRLQASFRVDNVVQLASCEDASFDVVIDGHCLHCIIGDDRAACLASVRRVLRPGGLFVVMTMCGEVLEPAKRSRLDANFNDIVHGNAMRHYGQAENITQEIMAAGFSIQSSQVNPREFEFAQDDLIVVAVAS